MWLALSILHPAFPIIYPLCFVGTGKIKKSISLQYKFNMHIVIK
jgi:hypothetical protein